MGRSICPAYHKGDPMSFEVRKSHGPFFSWEANFSTHQKVGDSPYFFKGIQGGPLSVINGVITPISKVITPVTHL